MNRPTPNSSAVAVHNDSAAVAEAAARELLALGFGDYAYLPYTVEKETSWSRERCECFAKLVRMNGKRFHAGPDGLNMSVEAEIPMTIFGNNPDVSYAILYCIILKKKGIRWK